MALSTTAPARPAQFDRTAQHRRAMMAKINIGVKGLNIDEDDYRQALFDATGQMSLKQCSDAQLTLVLEWLKSKGFRPVPKSGNQSGAGHPMARKARALWISLYHLGAVRNPSEEALEAFAKRQIGCDKLVWARQSDAYRLIEALKSMAARHGWRQTGLKGEKLSPMILQTHLCEVILARLKTAGAVPADWSLEDAAFRLCGTRLDFSPPFRIEQFARLAETLGRQAREMGVTEPAQ